MRAPLEGAPSAAVPDPALRAVAHAYAAATGRPYTPSARYARVNPTHAREYAQAYDEMADEPSERLTARSWAQMGDETLDQLAALDEAGYKFEFPRRGEDPYAATPRLALADLRDNKHMYVLPTEDAYGSLTPADEKNPLLKPVRGMSHMFGGAPFVQNDAFRAVHDALGHGPIGAGFRAAGEENAFRHHAALYSDLARLALTAETRGQNSWVNYGPFAQSNKGASAKDTTYAVQKSGVMPEFVYNRGLDDLPKLSIDELRRRIAALLVALGLGGAGRFADDEEEGRL